MRRLALIAILLISSGAHAQHPPPQAVAIPTPLANELITFLKVGGTWAQADGLAQRVIDAANEPKRLADEEKAIQKRIDDAKAAVAGAPSP